MDAEYHVTIVEAKPGVWRVRTSDEPDIDIWLGPFRLGGTREEAEEDAHVLAEHHCWTYIAPETEEGDDER